MAMKSNLFDPKMLDGLIKSFKNSEEMFSDEGIMKQFKKAILERMLEGELTTELGYEKHGVP